MRAVEDRTDKILHARIVQILVDSQTFLAPRMPQFRTTLDGLGIHFVHAPSPHPDAVPLVLTHGWPRSVVEFAKVLGPLTDPVAHGGAATDAFHVVCPSLPGYGFSDRPAGRGWTVERTAGAWAQLM